jgi:hypothetical protein
MVSMDQVPLTTKQKGLCQIACWHSILPDEPQDIVTSVSKLGGEQQ